MSCDSLLRGPRNADLQRTYTLTLLGVPFDLTGWTAALHVYAAPGSTALLTLGAFPTPNGSYIQVSDPSAGAITLFVSKADMTALPLGSPVTSPAALVYDLLLTSPAPATTRAVFGAFTVDPLGGGAWCQDFEDQLSLEIGDASIQIDVGATLEIVQNLFFTSVTSAPFGISPMAYGAEPCAFGTTPVVDDTAAWASAITAACALGFPVFVPAGSSLIDPAVLGAMPTNFPGFVGPGSGVARVFVKRASLGGNAVFGWTSPTGKVVCSGFTIDTNASIIGAGGFSISVSGGVFPAISDVKCAGWFQIAMLFTNCDQPTVLGSAIVSSSATNGAGIRFLTCSNGLIEGCRFVGSMTDNSADIDDCSTCRVVLCSFETANSAGFQCCIQNSTANCFAAFNTHENSTLEAFQMTTSQDCAMFGNEATWDVSHGQDFGSSVNGCVRCDFHDNVYEGSFKPAIAFAADLGPTTDCRAWSNRAINCGSRLEAVSSGLGAAFYNYASASFNNTRTTWRDNFAENDGSHAITQAYYEFNNGGSVTGARCRDFDLQGSGILSALTTVSGTRVWDITPTTYTPTLSASAGAIGTSSGVTASYSRRGQTCDWTVSFTMTSSGSGSGAVQVSLPAAIAAAGIAAGVVGRESAVTGKIAVGEASGTVMSVFLGDNTYAGGNGYVVNLGGQFSLQ